MFEFAEIMASRDDAGNVSISNPHGGVRMGHYAARDLALWILAGYGNAHPPGALKTDKDQRGIYGKFFVVRTDGKSAEGEKHHECEYFVLDLNHDKFAIPAVKAYRDACRRELPKLGFDLGKIVDRMKEDMPPPVPATNDAGYGFSMYEVRMCGVRYWFAHDGQSEMHALKWFLDQDEIDTAFDDFWHGDDISIRPMLSDETISFSGVDSWGPYPVNAEDGCYEGTVGDALKYVKQAEGTLCCEEWGE